MSLLDHASLAWARLPFGMRVGILRAVNHKVTLGVVGVITDGEGRVLLLDHRFRPRWTWGLPGGFLGKNEPLIDGLVREIREETGLVIDVDPEPFDVEHLVGPGAVTVAYRARARPGPLRLADGELRGGGFYAPDALPDGVYPHHLAIIRRWSAVVRT